METQTGRGGGCTKTQTVSLLRAVQKQGGWWRQYRNRDGGGGSTETQTGRGGGCTETQTGRVVEAVHKHGGWWRLHRNTNMEGGGGCTETQTWRVVEAAQKHKQGGWWRQYASTLRKAIRLRGLRIALVLAHKNLDTCTIVDLLQVEETK